MSNTSGKLFSCHGICWIVGALIGLVVAILIKNGWGLLVGIAVAIALALILQRLFCSEVRASSAVTSDADTAAGVAADTVAADTAKAPAATVAGTAAATGAADVAQAEADRAGAKVAAASAARKAEGERQAATARAVEAGAVEARAVRVAAREAEVEAVRKAAEAEAEAEAEEKAARADAAADAALAEVPEPVSKDFDGDGVLEGEGEGTRPEMLTAARGGKADDLKLIKGIGPKLEQLCNELGFYHWDQIANWTADEVAWVNANLKGFKGRVTRDDWVEQAKVLAAGGSTEFAARAEKSGLYDKNKG